MMTLRIEKGWFFGAGSTYNWTKDGHHIYGVGIKRDFFKEKEIEIEVEGDMYTLDMKKATDFVVKYKSHKDMNGVRIGIVSKSLLEPKTPQDDCDHQDKSQIITKSVQGMIVAFECKQCGKHLPKDFFDSKTPE